MVGDTTAFVTGKSSIDPKTLSTDDWKGVIEGALEKISMSFVRDFKGLRQILCPEGFEHTFVRSEITLPDQAYFALQGLKKNALFIECTDLIKKPTYEEWPTVQVPDTHIKGVSWPKPTTATDLRLLLSRDKQFYILVTTWERKDRWDDSYSDRYPADKWFESTSIEIAKTGIMELLLEFPKDAYGTFLGIRLLHRLCMIANKSEGELESLATAAGRVRKDLNGFLTRLGQGSFYE